MTTGYRIKTVASLTGVPRNTLLAWERRYHFVSPDRSGNRYRVYSEPDVTLIREVKALVDQGHAVSEAVGLVRARTSGAGSVDLARAKKGLLEDAAQEILLALLAFDRVQAEQLFSTLLDASYEDLLERVVFPILRRVGEEWSEGKITVVQEHFVSAFCRDHLVAIFLRLGCGPASGPRAACACFPDENHELGLLGVSIHLALQGWRVTHLGARVPEDSLRQFVVEHPPALLCISAVVDVPKKELLAYARRIRRVLPVESRLAIGGAGVPSGIAVDAVEGVVFSRSLRDLR